MFATSESYHLCLQHEIEAEARDRIHCHREQAREGVVSWWQGGCELAVSRRQGLEAGTYNRGKLDSGLVNGIAHLYG